MIKKIFFVICALMQVVHLQAMDGAAFGSSELLSESDETSSSGSLRSTSTDRSTPPATPPASPRSSRSSTDSVTQEAPKRGMSRQNSLDKLADVRAAVRANDIEQVRAYIGQGYPVFSGSLNRGQREVQPMKLAIEQKNVDMVHLLLEHDNHVDFEDEQGNTYLHILAEFGDDARVYEIFALLLDAHANPTLKNRPGKNKKTGETVYDIVTKDLTRTIGLAGILKQKHPGLFPGSPRAKTGKDIVQAYKEKKDTLSKGSFWQRAGYFSLGMTSTLAMLGFYELLFKKKAAPKKEKSEESLKQ